MRSVLLVLTALLVGNSSAAAQRVTVAAGISGKTSGLGDRDSDRGPAFRLGLDLRSGGWLTWGIEAGVDRFNAGRVQYTESCFLTAELVGTCFFDARSRDVGWSFGSLLRAVAATTVRRSTDCSPEWPRRLPGGGRRQPASV